MSIHDAVLCSGVAVVLGAKTGNRTSGQSNLTKSRIAAAHIRFNGICQMAPVCTHVIYASLGLPESSTQTASRSVQPFWHSSPHSAPILYNGPPLPLEIAPSHGGSGPSSTTSFLGPHRSPQPTRHLDRFSRFCRARYCDMQTDRPRYSVGNNRPHLRRLRSTAMRPNNVVKTYLKHSQKLTPI